MRFDADFGDLQRALDDLEQKIEKMKEHSMPLAELLDPAFMTKHTLFSSLEEMLERSGLSVASQEEFESIPQEQLDEYIAAHTPFAS